MPRRRTRDPLLCTQCAILADEYNLSSAEIGERFGFDVQRQPGMSPRSVTAERYANERRAILTNRKRQR